MKLSSPLSELAGVGPAYENKLAKLNLSKIEDLLFYFPRKYADYRKTTPINQLKTGQFKVIEGRIISIQTRRAWKRRMSITEGVIKDESGSIKLVWFNQPYLDNVLAGKKVLLAGEVITRPGGLVLSNPEYQLKSRKILHLGKIVPIYGQTKGISSKWLRTKVDAAFKNLPQIDEYLPEKIVQKKKLLNLPDALKQIHFPTNFVELRKAKQRLAFDELFLYALQSQINRQKIKKENAVRIKFKENETKQFTESLPFQLTDDQKRASWQMIQDLEQGKPMNRIINGDVGSGKTVVAGIGGLQVVLSGYQVAVMAPTEVLAQQHYQTLKNWFQKQGIKIELFIQSKKTIDLTKDQKEPMIIVGTQALIQEKIKIPRLALVIIDEQHRFGVEQRSKLIQKSNSKGLKGVIPHFLSMTATPIPRTLSLALYGDLDVSFIKQMPANRKKIITKIINPKDRNQAYQFIEQLVNKKEQIFVICPLIEETETDYIGKEKKTVLDEYQKLKKEIFPHLKIDYLHGQLKSKEKDRKMEKFKQRKTDILVSTSVIEVGIDIPNATMMMIEGAERFGLSQLHQFRGRVGRSDKQSYCYLFPQLWSAKIKRRLSAITQTNDGFQIAEEDLKIRGPGEIFGTRQHGILDFKLASFFDLGLMKQAQDSAKEIVEESNDLTSYPKLKKQLTKQVIKAHLE